MAPLPSTGLNAANAIAPPPRAAATAVPTTMLTRECWCMARTLLDDWFRQGRASQPAPAAGQQADRGGAGPSGPRRAIRLARGVLIVVAQTSQCTVSRGVGAGFATMILYGGAAAGQSVPAPPVCG